jgi:molybdopterin molybdotransferase
MIPVELAETLILAQVQPLTAARDGERVPLLAARGRILAADLVSPLDFPHWDNSAMDGYAVRYADVAQSSADRPTALTVIAEIPAGCQPQQAIGPGQAARILTGSVMPAGADTVVMQENADRDGNQVQIRVAPSDREFVRHQGAFAQVGDQLLAAGTLLRAPELAILAASQVAQVTVLRRPRVAILSTGSELVGPDQPLKPGQIVDSNQYALAALVEQLGAEAVPLGIVPDRPEALRAAMASAMANHDMVISSGGVSVGDYDFVDQILAELGAEIHIRAIAVKPGKPLTFATAAQSDRATLYFGLPGNPVSALVTFCRFVQPAIHKLAGRRDGWLPALVPAIAQQALSADRRRETYLWGQVTGTDRGAEFALAGGSFSSGNLINLAGANGLARVPIGQPIAAGEQVWVLPI